jgi:hypothetical protein
MLFYDCHIVAFDCAFNRCTADAAIRYFADADALAAQLADFSWAASYNRQEVRRRYMAVNIAGAYARLIKRAFGLTTNPFAADEHMHDLIEEGRTELE